MIKRRILVAILAGLLSMCLYPASLVVGAQATNVTLNPAFADKKATVNPALQVLVVRKTPSAEAAILEGLVSGVEVTLTGATETVANLVWWEIQTPSNQKGWIPEKQDGTPTLVIDGIPLNSNGPPSESPSVTRTPAVGVTTDSTSTAFESETVYVSVDILRIYAEPDTASKIIEAVLRDVPLTLVSAPNTIEDTTWYQVQTPSNSTGWIPQTIDGVKSFKSAAAQSGQLEIGAEAVVGSASIPLIMYPEPDNAAKPIEALVSGVSVQITDGPKDINGVRWWQVQSSSGKEGWVQDTVNGTVMLLSPSAIPTMTPTVVPTLVPTSAPAAVVPSSAIAIGSEVQVVSLEPKWSIRSKPSMKSPTSLQLARSEHVTIIGGPEAVSESDRGIPQNFTWWQVRTANGKEAWIQESYYGEPILVPYIASNPVPPVQCTLSTLRDVNIRSGPGSQFQQVASRKGAGQILAADGQYGNASDPSQHWWRLYSGFWIRDDQVREQTSEICIGLPVVSS